MNNLKIGSFIAALRKSKGLTQQELSIELDVSSKTVSKWECGDSIPEIQTLVLMSEFFDVSVDEILKGEMKRLSKQINDDTEQRFQSKKEKYLLKRMLSKMISLFWISIGLLIATLIFLLLYSAIPLAIFIVVTILFAVATFIIFMIANHYQFDIDDEEMSHEMLLKIKSTRFYFRYLYGNILIVLISLLTVFEQNENVVLVPLLFYPVFILISYYAYYDMRYKRFGYAMPKKVKRIIQLNQKYDILFLFIVVMFLLYTFVFRIYIYDANHIVFNISFIDVLKDQSIVIVILLSLFFIISITLYVFKVFKHKTYQLEWIVMMLLSVVTFVMSMNHYEQTLISLEQINYGSSGYSEMNLQAILMISGLSLTHLIGHGFKRKYEKKDFT